MVKILRNRSVVALIVCGLVLVALVVAATLDGVSKQTPGMNNIETVKKALLKRDEKICDEIKGDTRRDDVSYNESEVVFEKNVEKISEAEAEKRCRDGVKEVIEMDSKGPVAR